MKEWVAGEELLAEDLNENFKEVALPFNMTRFSNNGIPTYFTDDKTVHLGSDSTTMAQVSYPGKRGQIRDLTLDWAAADNVYTGVKLENYAYFLVKDTGASPDAWRVYRFDYTNLAAGGTLMTFAGATVLVATDNPLSMTSDGTYFYFTFDAGNSANSYVLAKYSLSGTTFTYDSSITCGAADEGFNHGGGFAIVPSGDIYTLNNTNDRITKFNSSGVQQYQEATDTVPNQFAKLVNLEDTPYLLSVSNPAGLLIPANVE